jgi:hypothetical protein
LLPPPWWPPPVLLPLPFAISPNICCWNRVLLNEFISSKCDTVLSLSF